MAFVGIQPSVMGRAPTLTSGAPQVLKPHFFAGGPRSAGGSIGDQSGRGWLVACAAIPTYILKKRGRDPQRPRRPLSAVLQYFVQNRKKIAGKSVPEQAKNAAKTYASMSEKDRQRYEKKAETALTKYRKDMKKYRSSGQMEKWMRDPARPRLPPNPYARFVAEQLEKTPGMTFQEVAAKWGKATAKKKDALSTTYASDFAKYEKQMESYRASGKEAKWKAEVGIKALEDIEAAKKQNAKELAREKTERVRAKAREKAQRERAKLRAQKEKERAREQQRAKREKDMEKAKAVALRNKEKKEKERARERQRAKREKEMEKAKAIALRIKEKKQKRKEKARAKAAALREKERALKMKAKALEAKVKSATKAKAKSKARSRATA